MRSVCGKSRSTLASRIGRHLLDLAGNARRRERQQRAARRGPRDGISHGHALALGAAAHGNAAQLEHPGALDPQVAELDDARH